MDISIPFNELTRSVISHWHTGVGFTLTWTMSVMPGSSTFSGRFADKLGQGCARRLDPLLAYPAWVRRTKPTGISNDVMGAVPGHPFFLKVIDSLPLYNRNWISPYITVMSSTGPLFLSLIWRHYNAVDEMPVGHRVRVLFPDTYMGHSWSFFSHHVGNSWHKWDTRLIIWVSHCKLGRWSWPQRTDPETATDEQPLDRIDNPRLRHRRLRLHGDLVRLSPIVRG